LQTSALPLRYGAAPLKVAPAEGDRKGVPADLEASQHAWLDGMRHGLVEPAGERRKRNRTERLVRTVSAVTASVAERGDR